MGIVFPLLLLVFVHFGNAQFDTVWIGRGQPSRGCGGQPDQDLTVTLSHTGRLCVNSQIPLLAVELTLLYQTGCSWDTVRTGTKLYPVSDSELCTASVGDLAQPLTEMIQSVVVEARMAPGCELLWSSAGGPPSLRRAQVGDPGTVLEGEARNPPPERRTFPLLGVCAGGAFVLAVITAIVLVLRKRAVKSSAQRQHSLPREMPPKPILKRDDDQRSAFKPVRSSPQGTNSSDGKAPRLVGL